MAHALPIQPSGSQSGGAAGRVFPERSPALSGAPGENSYDRDPGTPQMPPGSPSQNSYRGVSMKGSRRRGRRKGRGGGSTPPFGPVRGGGGGRGQGGGGGGEYGRGISGSGSPPPAVSLGTSAMQSMMAA